MDTGSSKSPNGINIKKCTLGISYSDCKNQRRRKVLKETRLRRHLIFRGRRIKNCIGLLLRNHANKKHTEQNKLVREEQKKTT